PRSPQGPGGPAARTGDVGRQPNRPAQRARRHRRPTPHGESSRPTNPTPHRLNAVAGTSLAEHNGTLPPGTRRRRSRPPQGLPAPPLPGRDALPRQRGTTTGRPARPPRRLRDHIPHEPRPPGSLHTRRPDRDDPRDRASPPS